MPAKSVAQRRAMAIEPTDAAYLAGFLDGEGYVTIRRANRYLKRLSYRLVVGFTNTDVSVLAWIQSMFGGAVNRKPCKNPVRHSPGFELTVHNRDSVRELLCAVRPYLHIKSKQAELGLAFLDLGLVKKAGTWPAFKALPGENERREDFKQALNTLNRRGPQCLQ